MLHFLELPLALGLLFLLIYYPCRWAVNRFETTERRRKIASWLVPAVLVPIIYVGLILFMFEWMGHIPSRDFDKASWSSDKMARFEMADDLLESRLLIGKDSSQLKEILGDPWVRRSSGEWVYDMGWGGGGFGFLWHHLNIQFKESRVLTAEYTTIQD